MKHIIRKILREQEQEIITAPPFHFFNYGWEDVLDWADGRLFRINGDINLAFSEITTLGGLVEVGGYLDVWGNKNLKSLGNLKSVGGDLNLYKCQNLESLGELRSVGGYLDLSFCQNLQSLGKLRSVGNTLFLEDCKNLQSLGELESVGGYLYISDTPIAKTMTEDEIRSQVDIEGKIYR